MKKRTILYGMMLFLAVAFTSCLGDPATNFTIANAAGVVGQEDIYPEKVIYVKGGDIISSEDFQSANVATGECILFDYAIDRALGENSNNGQANGYLTATIYTNTITEVPQWQLANQLTDTTIVLPEEQTISTLQQRFAYIKGKLFLFPEIANHPEAQVDSFALSYNPTQALGEGSVYNLYLRTMVVDTATASSKTMIVPAAFNIQDFVEGAAVADTETKEVRFRINYAASFTKDTAACVWKQSEVFVVNK